MDVVHRFVNAVGEEITLDPTLAYALSITKVQRLEETVTFTHYVNVAGSAT